MKSYMKLLISVTYKFSDKFLKSIEKCSNVTKRKHAVITCDVWEWQE